MTTATRFHAKAFGLFAIICAALLCIALCPANALAEDKVTFNYSPAWNKENVPEKCFDTTEVVDVTDHIPGGTWHFSGGSKGTGSGNYQFQYFNIELTDVARVARGAEDPLNPGSILTKDHYYAKVRTWGDARRAGCFVTNMYVNMKIYSGSGDDPVYECKFNVNVSVEPHTTVYEYNITGKVGEPLEGSWTDMYAAVNYDYSSGLLNSKSATTALMPESMAAHLLLEEAGMVTDTNADSTQGSFTLSVSGTPTKAGIYQVKYMMTAADESLPCNMVIPCVTITVTDDLAKVAKASLSKTVYAYDGKAKVPAVTVKLADGTKLVKGTDYTVAYSKNKLVGKATVKITGKGIYRGSITKTFTINPAKTTVKSLSKGTKSFKVTWTKKTAQVTGYQIRYSTKSSMASAKTVTVKSYKTTSKTVRSLKAKKKYYVQVRTYKTVNGTKYYSAWSAKRYVTTK